MHAGGRAAGATLVLWAWALFSIAGAIVAKTSEHWQRALPRAAMAHVAFSTLTALAAWAHVVSAAARNGHDGLYAATLVAWAALTALCLLAWTSGATRLAADVRCGRAVLRLHAWLAPGLAVAMSAMTMATLVWWAVVATVGAVRAAGARGAL